MCLENALVNNRWGYFLAELNGKNIHQLPLWVCEACRRNVEDEKNNPTETTMEDYIHSMVQLEQ